MREENTQPGAGRDRAAARASGAPALRPVRYALLALAAMLLVLWLLNLNPGEAVAQTGQFNQNPAAGQGKDALQQTLFNVGNYIALTILPLAFIGFLLCLVIKTIYPDNENAQYAANQGLKRTGFAVIGSGLALPLMGILQGLVAGG